MNEYDQYSEIPLTHLVQSMAPNNTFIPFNAESNYLSANWNLPSTMSNHYWDQNPYTYPEINNAPVDFSFGPPLDDSWLWEILEENSFLDEESSKPTPSDMLIQEPYKCDSCDKKFSARHLLNQHAKNHNKNVKCPVQGCEHRTAKPRDMFQRHLLVKHPEYCTEYGISRGSRPVCPDSKCRFNRIGFARKDHLTRHLKRTKHS
jgi:hypothetical protein